MKKNLNNTFRTSDTIRPGKKRRRRMGPNISDENIDNEIKALEKRLYYYRARKKGLENKDNSVKKVHNKRTAQDRADYQFYHYWTTECDYEKTYVKLYQSMVVSARRFIKFQTRLKEVFDKRATAEQKARLEFLINTAVQEINKQ